MRSFWKIFEPSKKQREKEFVEMSYKGYSILSSLNNVPGKHADNVFIVCTADTSFIIGLDDSKSTGYRTTAPTDLEDAINYIDWITENKTVNGYKIRYNDAYRQFQVSHDEIGDCLESFNTQAEAIAYAKKG